MVPLLVLFFRRFNFLPFENQLFFPSAQQAQDYATVFFKNASDLAYFWSSKELVVLWNQFFQAQTQFFVSVNKEQFQIKDQLWNGFGGKEDIIVKNRQTDM